MIELSKQTSKKSTESRKESFTLHVLLEFMEMLTTFLLKGKFLEALWDQILSYLLDVSDNPLTMEISLILLLWEWHRFSMKYTKISVKSL